MKTLPLLLVRKKFLYEQVERSNKAAIYSQKNEKGTLLAYEVFKVKKLNSYTLAGITFEESEPFPHDEAFGLWAWCVSVFNDPKSSLDRAQLLYKDLNTQVNETV